MNSLDLLARLRPFDEFAAAYRPGDEIRFPGLLLDAVGNTDAVARYAATTFLLDRGADVTGRGAEGHNVLHILVGHLRHDIAADVTLATRLLAGGADVNGLDDKSRLPLHSLMAMKFDDDSLAPLYDLWFAQPDLDVTTKNAWGLSPLDLARKVPFRSQAVARMEAL